MESTSTWRGTPTLLLNSGYVGGFSAINDNPPNSPLYSSVDSCFRLFGVGLGSSAIERDTLLFPTVTGLNPNSYYRVRFKLATIGITPSSNPAAGVDGTDYVQIESAINGASFIGQIKVLGSSNSVWGFGATGTPPWTGVLTKTASPALAGYGASATFPYSTVNLDFLPGTTQLSIRIIMAVNASGETWLIDDVELVELTQLPIELLSFTCEYTRDQNIIEWSVASQTNNDYFTLYRSYDGDKWDEIKRVAGEGTTTSIYVYEYVDRESCKGVVYYKLRQTDYDGLFKEFGPIASYCVLKDPEYVKWVNYLGQSVNENFKGPRVHYYIYK